jgi:hypothetical protein
MAETGIGSADGIVARRWKGILQFISLQRQCNAVFLLYEIRLRFRRQ